MTAVPAYGIDGLASDDRVCWAAQVPAAHSMIATAAVVLMILVSMTCGRQSFDIGPSPYADDPSSVRIVILTQVRRRRGEAEWRCAQVQMLDLNEFDVC